MGEVRNFIEPPADIRVPIKWGTIGNRFIEHL